MQVTVWWGIVESALHHVQIALLKPKTQGGGKPHNLTVV